MKDAPMEVLIIEDDPANSRLVMEMLAESRKPVFSAQHLGNLEDGLRLLRNRSFDVILIDLGLPDSQGLETALAVRNQAKQTPIIALAGFDDEDIALEALQSDIQDYLIKGQITADQLQRSVRYAMQRKHDMDALRQSEKWFESFMDHLPAPAWIKDSQGRYVLGNREIERLYSMPFSEFSGKTDEEILPLETARQFRKDDTQVLTTGESLQIMETPTLADGTTRPFLVSKFPLPGVDGRTALVGGIALDITDRVRAEEAVQKSEKKFATVFQDAPALLAISSLKDGRIVDVNKTLVRTLGYKRDELIGHTALELGIWDDLTVRAKILETLAEKGFAKKIEVAIKGKNGQSHACLFSGEYINIDGDRYMLAFGEDITDRKLMEEELKQRENTLRLFIEHSPAAIVMLDKDLKYVYASRSWLENFAHEVVDIRGRSHYEVFPDIPERWKEVHRRCLAGATERNKADLWERADGTSIWLHWEITPWYRTENEIGGLVIFAEDITNRKRAEEALQKSEQKFAKVFQKVPALLTISIIKDGTFIDVNETMLNTLGFQRDEIIGRSAFDLNIWEDPSDRKALVEALQNQGAAKDIEAKFRGKDGQPFVGLFSAEYIDVGGERYMLLLIKDITAIRRVQEEIEQLNTQLAARAVELEEANRELEAFNYSVAHDLRNPLNLIYGYSQMITVTCGVNLDEDCREYQMQISESILRMNKLISALLDFSRMAHVEPHRERFDLSGLAQAIATELVQSEPERRVSFRISEGVVVEGDRELLRVVLTNLLGNAWKYTARRGETIIEFGVTEINGKTTCFVRDNGPGFDMADAAKLFEPFQRLPGSEKRRGFGIGLGTVARVVKRHGGKVWAESEVGRGATFYFTLA